MLAEALLGEGGGATAPGDGNEEAAKWAARRLFQWKVKGSLRSTDFNY